jgi:hypothetical protein
MGGRRSQRPGPSPTLGSLGPSHQRGTSPGCHSGVPLVPMMFWALLMERCAISNGGMPFGRVDAGGSPPMHGVSVDLLEGCGMILKIV